MSRVNGCVLDEGNRSARPRAGSHEQPESGRADLEQGCLTVPDRLRAACGTRARVAASGCASRLHMPGSLACRLAVKRDEQKRARVALEQGSEFGVLDLLPGEVEDGTVDELDRARLQGQRVARGRDCRRHRIEVSDADRLRPWHRHEAHGRLGDDHQRTLRPDDEAGEIEGANRRAGRGDSRRRVASTAETPPQSPRVVPRRSPEGASRSVLPACPVRRGGSPQPHREGRSWRCWRRSAPPRGRQHDRWSCRRRSTRFPRSCCRSCHQTVARLLVEVSGPKRRPCFAAARLRSSCTTPGWTRAVRASGSSSTMASM